MPLLQKLNKKSKWSKSDVLQLAQAIDCSSVDLSVASAEAKDLWFQVRLLEARCGDALMSDQCRLEALDDCLGEYHNVVLLEEILITEALVPRPQTAGCLRVLRRYQAELRGGAASLGHQALAEKPAHFVRRIKRLWHTPRAAAAVRAKESRWRSAA